MQPGQRFKEVKKVNLAIELHCEFSKGVRMYENYPIITKNKIELKVKI